VTAVAAPAEVSDDDYDDGGEEAGRPAGSSLSRSSSFSDIGGESTDTEVCPDLPSSMVEGVCRNCSNGLRCRSAACRSSGTLPHANTMIMLLAMLCSASAVTRQTIRKHFLSWVARCLC